MMDCSKCEKGGVYNTTVPFVVHENLRAQMSAINARLIRVIVLLIFLLVGSNIAWLYYESQFVTETTHMEIEQDTDGGGDNYVVGRDLTYGKAESEDNDQEENP